MLSPMPDSALSVQYQRNVGTRSAANRSARGAAASDAMPGAETLAAVGSSGPAAGCSATAAALLAGYACR